MNYVSPDAALGEPEATSGRKPRPPYLFQIWAATGVYLMFELAFNSRLLDVAGGLTKPEQVTSIEQCGRIISGIALALGVCGMVVMPRRYKMGWPPGKYLTTLALVSAVCITFMYNFEKQLIDKLTDRSDGQSRRIAAHLQLLSHALLTQNLKLEGIDLSGCTLATPEGKTFIALFPVLAFSTNNLNEKAEAAIHTIIEDTVRAQIGGREHFYNETFHKSAEAILDAYKTSYVTGVNSMFKSLDDIPKTQENSWDEYVTDLRKHGYTPEKVPRMGWGRVRQDVRKQGVPVPDSWAPTDKATFTAVIRTKVEHEARRRYEDSIHKQFGPNAELPDNLTFEQFAMAAPVQRKWHAELKVDPAVPLSPTMSIDTYSRLVYQPMFDKAVREAVAKYTADAASFGPGGAHEALGADAMRALLVPPIALGFSLMGALVHLFKFSLFTAKWVSPWHKTNFRMIGSVVVIGALCAFLAPNPITRSEIYGYFHEQTKAKLSWVPSMALKWVIQAQPFAYPVNEYVRTEVLNGITFGYRPDPSDTDCKTPTPSNGEQKA